MFLDVNKSPIYKHKCSKSVSLLMKNFDNVQRVCLVKWQVSLSLVRVVQLFAVCVYFQLLGCCYKIGVLCCVCALLFYVLVMLHYDFFLPLLGFFLLT